METKATIDWEHTLINKIENNNGKQGFPSVEDFGITIEDVKDYAYDKQRIFDREEERKKKLVVPGIILVMPPIVLSAFRNDTLTLLFGVVIGLLLVFIYNAIMKAIDNMDIRKMRRDEIEEYITAVMDYKEDLA